MGAPEEDVGAYGRVLADHVIKAIPDWVESVVVGRGGTRLAPDARLLGDAMALRVRGPLLDLLTADIDAQRQSPLALLRQHVGPLTDFLRIAGVQTVERDPYDREAFPDDVYELSPKSWSDFGEDVADAGLRWGAAKAMAHRRRHAPTP